jgi:hypothetical protein
VRRSLGAVLSVTLALGASTARADLREILSVEWSLCDADVALDAEVVSVRPMTAEEHTVTVRRRGGARDEVLLRVTPRDAMDYREGERVLIFARAVTGWGHRVTRVIRESGAEAVTQDGTVLRGLEAIVARIAAFGPPRRERAVDLPYAPAGQGVRRQHLAAGARQPRDRAADPRDACIARDGATRAGGAAHRALRVVGEHRAAPGAAP